MRKLATLVLIGLLILAPQIGAAAAQSAPEFPTEIEAQKHCPSDVVVWVNNPSGIYHFKGMRWYGNTKNGAFVCQKEGDKAGYRATRNGQ
jgi:hypothetical protein